MRSAIVRLPAERTVTERRRVWRAAIRQLERAEIYLAAVAFMDLGDREAELAVGRLRGDLDGLRRYLVESRSVLQG